MTTQNIELAKKLTLKTLCGNLKSLAKSLDNKHAVPLIRVVGLARGLKFGTSNYGDWTALTGDFIAEPLHGDRAGERLRAGLLFLPDVALSLVQPYVEGLSKGDAIEVAFGIGLRADDETATGYVYTARFLQEPQANDPLLRLLNDAMPALPKPDEKAPTKATAKTSV